MRADRNQFEAMPMEAARSAYAEERLLFTERAHERSIVFHIARRLAALVDVQLPGFSVDVEYDLWHSDGIEGVKKVLRGCAAAEDASDDTEHDVYPDIAVHDRTGSTAEHNLLVVEVKKQETRGHDIDRCKLRAFIRRPFGYQNAAFLMLRQDGGCPTLETLEWITPR